MFYTHPARYRNFEGLHLRLRETVDQYASCGITLPPKRIFSIGTGHDTKFVTKRRMELHDFVAAILQCVRGGGCLPKCAFSLAHNPCLPCGVGPLGPLALGLVDQASHKAA